MSVVIFGGIYKPKHKKWSNGQSNGVCVPVMDEHGDVWMQDTYQLQRPSMQDGETETDAAIRTIAGFGDGYNGWCLKKARADFYHSNQERITSLEGYELIADLRDYRGLHHEDARDFKADDIIDGVRLFWEHGYSWNYGNIGVKVVKKNAVKCDAEVLRRMMQDHRGYFTYPYVFGTLKQIDELAEKCRANGSMDESLERDVEELKNDHDELAKLEREWNEYRDGKANE